MKYLLLGLLLVSIACESQKPETESNNLYVVVLGIAQDAGSPQIGCDKECCSDLWDDYSARQKVISLGIVDRKENKVWILDATPDFKDQLHRLLAYLPTSDISSLQGVFLTHAHIGHYTGLMDLGREAMGARQVPVYAMPRMHNYLAANGPWGQLVNLENIELRKLAGDSTIQLSENLSITPFLVPHRDEYSETVGYRVASKNRSFIFIPDIDKWQKWDRDIKDLVSKNNYAFLDGAFFSEDELPNRDMSEIPHPFVPETMQLFDQEDNATRRKIVFIHLNHTNPLLRDGPDYREVLSKGYKIGREGQIFSLD